MTLPLIVSWDGIEVVPCRLFQLYSHVFGKIFLCTDKMLRITKVCKLL